MNGFELVPITRMGSAGRARVLTAWDDSSGSHRNMVCSGSNRKESLGPIVTLKDFMEVYPYPTSMVGAHLTGAQLRQIVTFLMRDETITEDGTGDFYQFSKGFYC